MIQRSTTSNYIISEITRFRRVMLHIVLRTDVLDVNEKILNGMHLYPLRRECALRERILYSYITHSRR